MQLKILRKKFQSGQKIEFTQFKAVYFCIIFSDC